MYENESVSFAAWKKTVLGVLLYGPLAKFLFDNPE